jgi:hypothetical protein
MLNTYSVLSLLLSANLYLKGDFSFWRVFRALQDFMFRTHQLIHKNSKINNEAAHIHKILLSFISLQKTYQLARLAL